MQHFAKSLVWFRRDLRDYDHAALYHALKNSDQVFCIFIFDTDILDQLQDKADRRVEFIWESVHELKSILKERGGDLIVMHRDEPAAIGGVDQAGDDKDRHRRRAPGPAEDDDDERDFDNMSENSYNVHKKFVPKLIANLKGLGFWK